MEQDIVDTTYMPSKIDCQYIYIFFRKIEPSDIFITGEITTMFFMGV